MGLLEMRCNPDEMSLCYIRFNPRKMRFNPHEMKFTWDEIEPTWVDVRWDLRDEFTQDEI